VQDVQNKCVVMCARVKQFIVKFLDKKYMILSMVVNLCPLLANQCPSF